MRSLDGRHRVACGSHCFRPGYAGAQSRHWGANNFPNVPVVTQDGKPVKFYDDVINASSCFRR